MPWITPTNYTTFAGLLQYSNIVTSGWFAPVILFSIFTIMFISMNRYPTISAFSAASFITATVAVLFYMMDLVSIFILFISIVAVSVGAMMQFSTKRVE